MNKKIETITISKKTADKLKAVLTQYTSLLDIEIDSSINDESLKESYTKDLKEVGAVEAIFKKEVEESENKDAIAALFNERKNLFEQFYKDKIDEQTFQYKDDRIVDDLRAILEANQ